MIMVNVIGVAMIVAIVWWFWLYKGKNTSIDQGDVVVTVDHGSYQPSRIKAKAGESVTLKFLRKDASPCAEMVLLPELDISETLPVNKIKNLILPAMQPGEYDFHCQMQMYRGKLVVE